MKRFAFRAFLSLLSIVIAYRTTYFIGERYFFDRLFYQKSIKHGYWVPGKQLKLEDFGDRTKNLLALEQYNEGVQHTSGPTAVLGASDPSEYTVVTLGDSYVWGVGVRNEQRFVVLLEQMLDKVRPTRVIDLGNPGDNFFLNYDKYTHAKEYLPRIDLVVYGLVENDLLFEEWTRMSDLFSVFISQLTDGCLGHRIDNFLYDPTADQELQSRLYTKRVNASLATDAQNYCAYLRLVPLLPKDRAIYFSLDNLRWRSDAMENMIAPLTANGLFVYSPKPYYEERYAERGETETETAERLNVSVMEGHPNALAHKVYAEALFQEITTNPRWGFIGQNPANAPFLE